MSDRADRASFLVYDATSTFIWESVVLTGELSELPEEEREENDAVPSGAWQPEAFRDAGPSWGTKLYQFRIRETVGLKGTGLPDGLDAGSDDAP